MEGGIDSFISKLMKSGYLENERGNNRVHYNGKIDSDGEVMYSDGEVKETQRKHWVYLNARRWRKTHRYEKINRRMNLVHKIYRMYTNRALGRLKV